MFETTVICNSTAKRCCSVRSFVVSLVFMMRGIWMAVAYFILTPILCTLVYCIEMNTKVHCLVVNIKQLCCPPLVTESTES